MNLNQDLEPDLIQSIKSVAYRELLDALINSTYSPDMPRVTSRGLVRDWLETFRDKL